MAGNVFLKFALDYLNMGFSIIPVLPGEKKPAIKWAEFQTRRATAAEIVDWWRRWPEANLGIVTGEISDLSVIDFDQYKEGYNPDIEQQYFDNIITPTSKTPRGGTHLWFKNCGLSGCVDIFPGIDFRCVGNFIIAPPSKNGDGKEYKWVEGLELNPRSLTSFPEGFKATVVKFLESKGLPPLGGNKDILTNSIYICDKTATATDYDKVRQSATGFYVKGRRDDDLFHLANSLVKVKCDMGFVWQTLNIVAKNCEPPFPENEVNIKIQSALDRCERKEGKLSDDVREYVSATTGDFSATNIYNFLNIATNSDKKNVNKILERFCKNEKIIERVGNKNGIYRLIDEDSPIINITNADTTPLEIKFPLGIHELVKIHKSNVIIIAGESNSGKTALCMNVAEMNMNDWKVNYLSSEMQDGTELRIRLDEFQKPPEYWSKVDFRFRVDKFPDVIRPDDLNIVDYLDEGAGNDATHMVMRIRQISHKLGKGIAIICIQKSSVKQYGFGGEGTKNTARLYMTITGQNKLTIEKGKIWRNKFKNPNGAFIEFSLVGGCKFIKKTEWVFPKDIVDDKTS